MAVGWGDVGLGVHAVGFAPVQLSVTSALNPFTAVRVPAKVAFCVGNVVRLAVGIVMK